MQVYKTDHIWKTDSAVGTTEVVLYADALERERVLREALQKLLNGIRTCHYCGADLIPERGAAHCEDCPSGCESHDAPDCAQLTEIIEQADAALAQ